MNHLAVRDCVASFGVTGVTSFHSARSAHNLTNPQRKESN